MMVPTVNTVWFGSALSVAAFSSRPTVSIPRRIDEADALLVTRAA
jgi:hypothetical protein